MTDSDGKHGAEKTLVLDAHGHQPPIAVAFVVNRECYSGYLICA